MTQLLLDMRPVQPATLENFVAGANAELLARLGALADRRSFDSLYLWGPSGSGKSHLLAATAAKAAAQRPVRLFSAANLDGELVASPGSLVAIDDIDRLGDDAQIALFRLFNAARLAGLALLLAGPQPPARLALREDLRTRIGQALAFELRPLSDDDKAAALQRHALMRGMRMEPGLIRYLLRHGRRDLPSLMAVLDQLDQASLQQHRAATLPLLKQVMELQFDEQAGSV